MLPVPPMRHDNRVCVEDLDFRWFDDVFLNRSVAGGGKTTLK